VQDLKKTTELKFINNTSECSKLAFTYLGLTEYIEAYRIQLSCLEEAFNNKEYKVLGVEHPAVLTLGLRANVANEVLIGNTIKIEKINRGGLATIHSPGQLVIYPILNIRELKIGIRKYIQLLLTTTQKTLQNFDINSFQDEAAIGLYTNQGKIAFCGVQVQRGCTLHGLSLNVFNDLSLFKHIQSCGIRQPLLDKVQNYRNAPSLQTIFETWSEEFSVQLKTILK
jgi:lipoyl(octanoyl) transferase